MPLVYATYVELFIENIFIFVLLSYCPTGEPNPTPDGQKCFEPGCPDLPKAFGSDAIEVFSKDNRFSKLSSAISSELARGA